MSFLNSNSKSENPKSRNLSILQKLKQARAEEEAQICKEEKSQEIPNASKRFVDRKFSKREISSSSSSSSHNDKLQLIRRSTAQEKLFAAQCERSRQNFKKYRWSRTESESSSNTINQMQRSRAQGNSKYPFKKYNGYNDNGDDDDDDDDKSNIANCNKKGNNESDDEYNKTTVLHLKKPLQSVDCDDINYFNKQSRMEFIDWSLVNGETNETNKNTSAKPGENIYSKKEIKQIPDGLPIGNTDFINFVNNSTTNDTVYSVYNNLKNTLKTGIESPILKIQKAINQFKTDAVIVTQEIKESFEPTVQDPKIIDLIDVIIKKSPSFQNKQAGKSKLYYRENDVNTSMQKIQKRNIEEFKRSQLKEINAGSINIPNTSNHAAERKKMMDEYSDDMIAFVKPNSKLISSSAISYENSDERLDINENSDSAYVQKKLIDKFKHAHSPRVNSSLDSDDVSTERSSELDDLSASRRSTISKYESLKRRLFSASTQTSPPRSTDKVNRRLILKNNETIQMDKSEEEPLIKERFTRYLRKPDIIVDKTVREMEKDIPNKEPFLKPVSTRYFSTSSKEKIAFESKDDLKIEENTKIIKTTESDSIFNKSNIVNKEFKIKEDTDEIEENIKIIKTTESESISNESSISNKEFSTEEDNDKIEEIASDPKEIKENDKNNYFNESKHKIKIQENIIKIRENDLVVNKLNVSNKVSSTKEDIVEIEEIISGTKEIKENNKNNCRISSSEEFILNKINTKINNNLNNDSTTSSSCEKSSMLSIQSGMQNQSSLTNSKEEPLPVATYEDINSEEEFDVVNCEQFFAFTSLLNKLQTVAAAQKEHALGIANELNNNDIDENDSQNHLKAIESSLDISDNNFSSISASVSSNLESDNDTSTSSSTSSNFLLTNKNIFENVEIDMKHLNNYHLNIDELSDAAKLNNEIKEVNKKTEMSVRQKKKLNALQNYRNSKNAEGGNTVLQKNDDAAENDKLKYKAFRNQNQILEEIKKQNLHLNCKPWVGQNL